MRNLILTLVLLVALAPSLSGQGGNKQIACCGQGSAAWLEGKIYVLTVFLSETSQGNYTSHWTKAETDAWFRKLYEAENWLQRQAARYGKRISFSGGYYGLSPAVYVDYIAAGAGVGNERTDWVSVALAAIGYRSPMEFHRWVQSNTDCQSSLVMVVADKPGRSYAMVYDSVYDRERYFVEGVMYYMQYSDGREQYSSSIAHEICHVFGADDLYATFAQSAQTEAVARQYFPNDIMHRTSQNINDLNIGPFSAWLMGLSDREESWYRSLLPSSRLRQR